MALDDERIDLPLFIERPSVWQRVKLRYWIATYDLKDRIGDYKQHAHSLYRRFLGEELWMEQVRLFADSSIGGRQVHDILAPEGWFAWKRTGITRHWCFSCSPSREEFTTTDSFFMFDGKRFSRLSDAVDQWRKAGEPTPFEESDRID